MNTRPRSIGVTGGIGSGKSTVAGFLADGGGVLIDADAASRKLTSPGGAAMAAIAEVFGAAMVDAQGGLDRAAMRNLVFSDPSARLRLETIVHPLIWQEIDRLQLAAQQSGAALLIFDVPLLVEMRRWRPMLDAVLVVDCSPTTQHQRVRERSGMDAAQTQRIMDAQASRAQRLACADHVLVNEGLTLAALRAQVHGFLQTLRL
ncbi:MAG: dephospho-CoA kinase [Betaproteobacteria bacterium]|nr:dephospho-CoA kinase [Betaproteobacteria bacterium]